MAYSNWLTDNYLKDLKPPPVKIFIMEGEMPLHGWPDAKLVFVLDPTPVDIAVVANVHKQQGKLILVSHITDKNSLSQNINPLREFFALPEGMLAQALTYLLAQKTCMFLMTFQRRSWHRNLLPRNERDSFIVTGKQFLYEFQEYMEFEGSFEFDDAYRRRVLGECTLAQSTAHFLHVLENLQYTNQDTATKRSTFRGVFPFYTGNRLDPDIPFEWTDPTTSIHKAVISGEITQHAAAYAVAIACLSEIGSAFTHCGRHDLYLALMGNLVRLEKNKIRVGNFHPTQIEYLREKSPFLYLHVFYRVPNQFIIAMLDEARDLFYNHEIIAAAEELLHRMNTEETFQHLKLVKRSLELAALSGTLCQIKTFTARRHGDRKMLLEAKEHALMAIKYAHPVDLSRDTNYRILTVLTDWLLFAAQTHNGCKTFEEEYDTVVQALDGHLSMEPGSYYNIMIACLSAAVEAVCHTQTRILDLLKKHDVGPGRLEAMFRSTEYDQGHSGSYALCLAAGYASLLCSHAGWNTNDLEFPMEKASDFFFCSNYQGREGLILKIIALKYAACRLFYLNALKDVNRMSGEAKGSLVQLQDLSPQLGSPDILVNFFKKASTGPEEISIRESLMVVFTLPY